MPSLFSEIRGYFEGENNFFDQTSYTIPSLNTVNAISIITTLRCHCKIIRNEGLFCPLKPLQDMNL